MGWLRTINLASKPNFPKPIVYVEWELPKAPAPLPFGSLTPAPPLPPASNQPGEVPIPVPLPGPP